MNGDCSGALVAATNLIIGPERHLAFDNLGALSRSAHCHSFDASADGYARAEAVNVMYIKKLSQAIKDGDPIRAVIRGSGLTA